VPLPASWRSEITFHGRGRCSAYLEGTLAYCVSGLRAVLHHEHYAALSELKINNSTAIVTRRQPPHIELISQSQTPKWPAKLTSDNKAQYDRMAEFVRHCKPCRLEWWGVGNGGPAVQTSVLVLVLARSDIDSAIDSDSDSAIGRDIDSATIKRLHITVVAARRTRLNEHGPAEKVMKTAKAHLDLIERWALQHQAITTEGKDFAMRLAEDWWARRTLRTVLLDEEHCLRLRFQYCWSRGWCQWCDVDIVSDLHTLLMQALKDERDTVGHSIRQGSWKRDIVFDLNDWTQTSTVPKDTTYSCTRHLRLVLVCSESTSPLRPGCIMQSAYADRGRASWLDTYTPGHEPRNWFGDRRQVTVLCPGMSPASHSRYWAYNKSDGLGPRWR